MTAAIFAAREGAQVVLLEHKDRVGKKILSTGNGRCNLSNRLQEPFCYRSGQPDFPWKALGAFTLPMTLEYFEDLGVLTRERDGYLCSLRIMVFRGFRFSRSAALRRARSMRDGMYGRYSIFIRNARKRRHAGY